MRNSFLITCYGRSGSKFLASTMNLSPTWTVRHEPRKAQDQLRRGQKQWLQKIQSEFNKDNYGEVNSYLRFWWEQIRAQKKGIIMRNPQEVFLSVANRKPKNQLLSYAKDIKGYWALFNKLRSTREDIFFIDFEKMVSDVDYLLGAMAEFGVTDIPKEKIALSPVNQNKEVKYRCFGDLPPDAQKIFKTTFQ